MSLAVSPGVGLLGELVDLKRVRVGGVSVATTAFARAWGAIAAGEDPETVAAREAALALAATKLGAIDVVALRAAGLPDDAIAEVFRRASGEPSLDPLHVEPAAAPPAFVAALAAQPRAGVTAPGRPRLVLEPAESHAEHCWAVAVVGALVAPAEGAARGPVFLCGLAHHLHNATLADAGFAGETALGEHLEPIVAALTERALAELAEPVQVLVRDALRLVGQAESPEARAFNAADVLDRVLELRWHERAARFTVREALEDFDLVHEGPLQAFGLEVLERWGLR